MTNERTDPFDPSPMFDRLALSVSLLLVSTSLAISVIQAAQLERGLDSVTAAAFEDRRELTKVRDELRSVRMRVEGVRQLSVEAGTIANAAHARLDRIHSTNGYILESGGRKMDLLCVDAAPEAKVEPPDYASTSCVTSCAIPGDGYYVSTGTTTLEPFKASITRLP